MSETAVQVPGARLHVVDEGRSDPPVVLLHAGIADLRSWDDVAHMIGMETPDELSPLIVEFLAPLPRWS